MEPAAISLRATGRGRRRLLANRVAESAAVLAAVLAIAVLAVVIWSVGSRGDVQRGVPAHHAGAPAHR